MAGTLRSVLKLLIGETKDAVSAGCTFAASVTPKGPGLESIQQHISSELGLSPEPFSLTLQLHCSSPDQSAHITSGLREMYAAKKETSPVIAMLEGEIGIETEFEQSGEKVLVKMRLKRTEAPTAMCGMVESMLPEVFTQSSKLNINVSLAKDLHECTDTDLQMLYALFEGCKVEVTMELWRNLLHYLRTQLKDTMLSAESSKLLTLASIYSRGSIELKLRGAHAIPTEIREQIATYSHYLSSLREFIASGEEPAISAFVKAVADSCQSKAEAVLNSPLGVIVAEVNVPGLATVFLKES